MIGYTLLLHKLRIFR